MIGTVETSPDNYYYFCTLCVMTLDTTRKSLQEKSWDPKEDADPDDDQNVS